MDPWSQEGGLESKYPQPHLLRADKLSARDLRTHRRSHNALIIRRGSLPLVRSTGSFQENKFRIKDLLFFQHNDIHNQSYGNLSDSKYSPSFNDWLQLSAAGLIRESAEIRRYSNSWIGGFHIQSRVWSARSLNAKRVIGSGERYTLQYRQPLHRPKHEPHI